MRPGCSVSAAIQLLATMQLGPSGSIGRRGDRDSGHSGSCGGCSSGGKSPSRRPALSADQWTSRRPPAFGGRRRRTGDSAPARQRRRRRLPHADSRLDLAGFAQWSLSMDAAFLARVRPASGQFYYSRQAFVSGNHIRCLVAADDSPSGVGGPRLPATPGRLSSRAPVNESPSPTLLAARPSANNHRRAVRRRLCRRPAPYNGYWPRATLSKARL
jgi:hypothetical protein